MCTGMWPFFRTFRVCNKLINYTSSNVRLFKILNEHLIAIFYSLKSMRHASGRWDSWQNFETNKRKLLRLECMWASLLGTESGDIDVPTFTFSLNRKASVSRMLSITTLYTLIDQGNTIIDTYYLNFFRQWSREGFTLGGSHALLHEWGKSQRLYVGYNSNYTLVSDEQYLYDLNAIISAVGGGLGLFVGVSAFGLFELFLNYISKLFKLYKTMSKNKI